MKKIAVALVATLALAGLTACGETENCEWEKEKNKKPKAHAMVLTSVGDEFAGRVSGGTGGGGRGGGGGSRGGSRGSGGSSGGSKAKPPRPAAPPPAGYHWDYDCD